MDKFSILALVLGGGSLAVAGAAYVRRDPPAMDEARIATLEQRLEQVSAVLDAVRVEVRDRPRSPPPVREPAPDGAPVADVRAQVERLAERVGELEDGRRKPDPADPAGELARLAELLRARQPKLPDPAEVTRLQDRARDANQSEEERLRALRDLRGMDGGRSPEVISAMVDWYWTQPAAGVRADIFRQLHRAPHPRLKEALVHALQNAPEREVREEAAETLGDYLDDPYVVTLLQGAAANDKDGKVKSQAQQTLDEGD